MKNLTFSPRQHHHFCLGGLGARWYTMRGASYQSWNMKWISGPRKVRMKLGWDACGDVYLLVG